MEAVCSCEGGGYRRRAETRAHADGADTGGRTRRHQNAEKGRNSFSKPLGMPPGGFPSGFFCSGMGLDAFPCPSGCVRAVRGSWPDELTIGRPRGIVSRLLTLNELHVHDSPRFRENRRCRRGRDARRARAFGRRASITSPVSRRTADGSIRLRARRRGAERREGCRRVVRRRAHRPLPPAVDQHARAPDHRRRPTPSRTASAFARSSTARGDSPRPANMTKDGVVSARARPRASRARRRPRRRALSSSRPTPVEGHLDDARSSATRSTCRSKKKSRCSSPTNEAALKVPRIRFVHLGPAAAARSQDAREHRRHAHHADVHPRRAVVQRHRGRRRRLPELHAKNSRRAARAGNTSSRSTCRATPPSGRRSPSRNSRRSRSRPGRYDLILQPTNLWLTIHESIGHPTELDRAMGYEANFAGTSFVAPPEKMIGKLKYGSRS